MQKSEIFFSLLIQIMQKLLPGECWVRVEINIECKRNSVKLPLHWGLFYSHHSSVIQMLSVYSNTLALRSECTRIASHHRVLLDLIEAEGQLRGQWDHQSSVVRVLGASYFHTAYISCQHRQYFINLPNTFSCHAKWQVAAARGSCLRLDKL